MILELNIDWNASNKEANERVEIFNFKKEEDMSKFIKATTENYDLKALFNDENEDMEHSTQKWLKTVNRLIASSFSKVRVKYGKICPELEKLFILKEELKQKIAKSENNDDLKKEISFKAELEIVSKQISDVCSDRNKQTVKEYIGDMDPGLDGFRQIQTWGLKKNLCSKNVIDPPAAKRDASGELVTDRNELEKLYLKTYVERLTPNPINEDLKELKDLKEYLFYLRKKLAQTEVSRDWNIYELEKVLKSLKNGKARDAYGHIYEIYKFAGSDLKNSILRMFNLIKKNQVYPKLLQSSNISSFYKKKGDRSDLNSDRGVFNVVKIRTILDKLVYNDFYDIIDSKMSCSNIGARKNRNIRDHLFVINSIFNDIIHNKNNSQGVDIGIYDIAKCFDKMWYAETANDLFQAGVKNDKFILVANSNKECQVAIKTPWGSLTDRVTLNEIEMQGTVLSKIKCSVQVDLLGQDCIRENKGIYKYKGCTSIPPLSMVDDVITVSNCGMDSIKVNGIVQSKVECKQLQLGLSKCFQMHVGKKNKHLCPQLKIHGQAMKTSDREKYLRDILTTDGKLDQNIKDRFNKGVGKTNELLVFFRKSLLNHITLRQPSYSELPSC